MRAPTPIEVCKQIAAEHAAGTLAAIAQERAAKLTDPLAEYAQTLSELAAANGERDQTEAAPRQAGARHPSDAGASPTEHRGSFGPRDPQRAGGSPPPTEAQPAMATALAEPGRAPRAPHRDVNDEKEGLTT